MFDLDGGDFRQEILETGTDGQIAVIDLDGMIMDTGSQGGLFAGGGYDHRVFMQMLEVAAEDASVDGIVINVNTPGGGVVESAAIHDRIVRAQEEFDTEVYVSMGSMAASGGYYIAAPADYISAHSARLPAQSVLLWTASTLPSLLKSGELATTSLNLASTKTL
ncbi:protease IV [Geomicrobium sp. JCM 19055]|nr:protease IV [Geomicrobium sp. JCM 19055]